MVQIRNHIAQPSRSEKMMMRYGRDFAYKKFGEEHTEVILNASRPIRFDNRVPVFGYGLEACEGNIIPLICGGGFASYNEIITALTTAGRAQNLFFSKASFTTVSAFPYSYFTSGGLPIAQAFGSALTGRTLSSATTGAIAYTNSAGGRTMHVVSAGIGGTVNLGTFILIDKLAEYPFNGATTGANNFNAGSGVVIPARDATGTTNGAGVLPFVENIQAATTAANPTLTLTYTDDGGNTAQSTGAITMPSTWPIGRILYNNTTGQFPWFTMASGDVGMQNITAYNLSATLTSTQLNIGLARPLGFLPNLSGNDFIERDFVIQLPSLIRLYDSSMLSLLLISNATTCACQGRITIAEG